MTAEPEEPETLEDTQGERDLDPRRCLHIREDGEQCKGYRVKGEQLCAGHLGLGVAAGGEVARDYQRQGAIRRSELVEERKRTPAEAYRAALVGNAERLADELIRIATEGESDADRLRAIEALSSRVLGRPTEKVEHTVKVPQTSAELEAMTIEELDALIGDYELAGEIGPLALPPGNPTD